MAPVILVAGSSARGDALRDSGFDVVLLSEAAALLAQAEERPAPGAILLELGVPGLDALDLCRQLKANADTRRVAVLPAMEVSAEHSRQVARPVVAHAGTETILVVEDEVNVRHLVQRVLKSRGYDVLEARDVTHAAEIAAEHPGEIHLLLSDVVMPGLSGPQLAERIVFARPRIRVLYMSGFASRISAELGLSGSDAVVLHKPFTPEHLVRTVRECLDAPASSPTTG